MLPGTALYNQPKFVGTENSGRAQAPEIMPVLLGINVAIDIVEWGVRGVVGTGMTGPPLIGCISIIISLRPPLPIWLHLLPFDWLHQHSSAIYKSPPGCFFSFLSPFATLVFFSLSRSPCLGFTVCVCEFHDLTRLQRRTNTKGLSTKEDWIKTKRGSYSCEGDGKAFRFRCKQDWEMWKKASDGKRETLAL